jgi:hypothetical protein
MYRVYSIFRGIEGIITAKTNNQKIKISTEKQKVI